MNSDEIELDNTELEIISDLILRECKAYEDLGYRVTDEHGKVLRELFLKIRKVIEKPL